jgi:hypothetical protein
MDTLSNTLNPNTNVSYHPSILAAMKLARKKMDRYYSLTDFSATYRIAMGISFRCLAVLSLIFCLAVLHPGLKLEYFRRHEWEDDWIEQAENMVREEYIGTYENKDTASVDDAKAADKVGLMCRQGYDVPDLDLSRLALQKVSPNLLTFQLTLRPRRKSARLMNIFDCLWRMWPIL